MTTNHRDDGLNVLLDFVCVALSVALIPTGIGLVAGVALAGGALLLAADGLAYGLELGGKDRDAEDFKRTTEKYRVLATVAALPDGLVGGWRALRELGEVREVLALDRATINTGDQLAARTSNAARNERYQQIAEKARLRSQIRTEQINASLKHEIAPRGAGLGSAALFVREEWLNDESMLHSFIHRLQVHCTAVHA